MSDLIPVEFGKQFGDGRDDFVSMELLENCYAEPHQDSGRSSLSIVGTPGLVEQFTAGDGPCRGIRKLGNSLYAVSGGELYRITRSAGNSYTATLIGGVAGTGPVDMSNNATHVFIVTSTLAYAANSDGIVELDESGLVGAAYQDGYGIFGKRGTDDWYITAVDDYAISALDFTNADTLPDDVVGVVSDHGQLGIFGEESIEWYQNTGNAAFPFERVERVERGCAAGGSIAKADNRVFWLGDDLRVYEASGYHPKPISTSAVVHEISRQVSPDTARGYIYAQDNRTHYVLTLNGTSLVYTVDTGLWHKRVSDGESRWRVSGHAYQWGKHIVGDFDTNQFYALDLDTYDEGGRILRRRLLSPTLFNQGNLVITDELFVDMHAGVGLSSGQGSDPQLMLRHSDDSGHTWSNELWRGIGKQGEYKNRARWHRLGASRSRIYEMSMTDPVPFRMLGAYARVERLAA